MTSEHGFVWFLPVYVSTKVEEGIQEINDTCSESEMRGALDLHFALSYSSFGNDSDVIEGNQTIEDWKKSYLDLTGQNKTHFSDYAGYYKHNNTTKLNIFSCIFYPSFTYDAIWIYAIALQQLIKEGKKF